MYKKNSLTNIILTYLEETSKDLLNASSAIVFNPRKFMRNSISLYRDPQHSFYKPIHNLKRSPFFTVKNDEFYLSSAGRIKIIKNIIQRKREAKIWDKKWRAVVFDIPESNRHERNFLRKELKWMGFKELQHSIWITPYDTERELLFLLEFWQKDFKGDIKFLVAEKITNDADFRKQFNLKK